MTEPLSAFEPVSDFVLHDELPVKTLSPSSISKLLTCPEQFRRQYVKGEKDVTGYFGIQGNAFHDTRHAYLKRMMEDGHLMSELEIVTAFNGIYGAAMKDSKLDAQQKDDLYLSARAMTLAYAETIGPHLPRPNVIEGWCRFYLPGIPIPVIGRIDYGHEGGIIDTKTMGRSAAKKMKPEWIVQGLLYLRATGLPKIEWHTLATLKNGVSIHWPGDSPELVLHSRPSRIEVAELFVRRAYDDLVSYNQRYGPDQPWPGAGVAKGSCLYCHLKNTCPYYVF